MLRISLKRVKKYIIQSAMEFHLISNTTNYGEDSFNKEKTLLLL